MPLPSCNTCPWRIDALSRFQRNVTHCYTEVKQQFASHSVLLATVGGTVGAYLAWIVPGIIVGLVEFAPAYSLTPDWNVFAYLAAVTLAAGCLAVLAPAAESLRADVSASLKSRAGLFGQGAVRWRPLDFLVAGQIATSLVLLAASAVCVRAQYTMFAAGPGFEIEHVLAGRIGSTTDGWAFRNMVSERLRSVPGVVSVCFAEFMPMEREDSWDIRVAGQPAGTGRVVAANFVSANFFETLGIPKAPFVLDTHDPLIYFVVCLLLVMAATVAMLIPTLRATSVNPVQALREE